MAYRHVTFIIIFLGIFATSSAVDKGFRLLFTSNRRSLRDYPVAFSKPRPAWLNGTYIRNGLGQFEMGTRTLNHIFDGFAKLSCFRFLSPNVTLFSTRFIKTNYFSESKAKDDIAPYLLFDSANPPFDAHERFQALLHGIDNTNINFYKFTDSRTNYTDYMAVSDFWQGYKINPHSLKTYGRLDPDVPGGGPPFGSMLPLPSTSHPVREFGTTNHISFVSILNPIPFFYSKMRIIRIRSSDRRDLITEIPMTRIPYMHSFGLSKRYAIILAAPVFINNLKMVRTAEPVHSLDWFPKEPMVTYVIDIKTGKYVAFDAPAVFPMHHINSYEEGDSIITDFVTYPDLTFMCALEVKKLERRHLRNRIPVNSRLMRFTINLKKKSVKSKTFGVLPGNEFINTMDMPVINENYRHKKYCYVYGITLKSDYTNLSNSTLVKKDLCHSKDKVWHKVNHFPSEPWFEPRPGAKSEDDGVLLSVVLDGNNKKSYLGIWNAATLEPIDQGYLPFFVPFSLHGRYFHDL